MDGVELIAVERQRQVDDEGWTYAHDDEHQAGELAEAATCYSMAALYNTQGWNPKRVIERISWPWEIDHWKPSDDPIRNLVKAGALIAAEIDRLQRKVARKALEE